MVSAKDLYCKATYNSNKNKKKNNEKIKETSEKISKDVKNLAAIADTEINKGISSSKNKFMDFIYSFQYAWNNRYGKTMSTRHDLIFIYDLILVFMLIYILHQIIFRIVPLIIPLSKGPAYMKQLLNIPESKISLKRLEKERVKIHSIGEHDKYFRLRPFSELTESDKMTMQHAQLMIQIMILLAIFLGVPFIIAYVIWFAVKYTPFFWRTAKGLFKTMFRYFFRLIKAAASRKWVIRTIMGWPKLPYPDLASEHLIPWKRTYIDPWIDREFMYYEILYRRIREKYYYQPKRRYIEIPYAKLKLFLKQLKREYIDLTYKEFWLLILDTYPKFVALPENELYLKLYGADAYIQKYQNEVRKKIQETRTNVGETTGKCLGTSYKSVSKVSGEKCKCPSGQPHSCGIVSDVSSKLKDATGELAKEFDCSKEHTKLNNLEKDKKTSGFIDFDNVDNVDINNINVNYNPNKGYKIFILVLGIIIKTLLAITIIVSVLIILLKLFGIPEKLKKFIIPSTIDDPQGNYIFKKSFLSELFGVK